MPYAVQRPKIAYVKDNETGEFIVDQSSGKHLKVTIEKAIRISKDDKAKHRSRTYWSLQPDEAKRYRLKVHTVNHQFERFNKGDSNAEFDRNYDESMSHKCVVEALSRLSKMTLIIVNGEQRAPLTFNFETVRKEPYIHLPNNAKYYPDVMCTFNEEHEMYDKWGGKIAIEVTYTHGCESYKKEDFLFHNIPVFEVIIEDGSARQFPAERPNWPKGKLWDESLVERHINDLVRWFSENVVGELKVDPTSTRVHLTKMQECQSLISELESEKSLLKQEVESIRDLKHEHSLLIRHIESANREKLSLSDRNSKLLTLLESEKQRYQNVTSKANEAFESTDEKITSQEKTIASQKIVIYGCFALFALILFTPFLSPEWSAEYLNKWYTYLVKLRQALS